MVCNVCGRDCGVFKSLVDVMYYRPITVSKNQILNDFFTTQFIKHIPWVYGKWVLSITINISGPFLICATASFILLIEKYFHIIWTCPSCHVTINDTNVHRHVHINPLIVFIEINKVSKDITALKHFFAWTVDFHKRRGDHLTRSALGNAGFNSSSRV